MPRTKKKTLEAYKPLHEYLKCEKCTESCRFNSNPSIRAKWDLEMAKEAQKKDLNGILDCCRIDNALPTIVIVAITILQVLIPVLIYFITKKIMWTGLIIIVLTIGFIFLDEPVYKILKIKWLKAFETRRKEAYDKKVKKFHINQVSEDFKEFKENMKIILQNVEKTVEQLKGINVIDSQIIEDFMIQLNTKLTPIISENNYTDTSIISFYKVHIKHLIENIDEFIVLYQNEAIENSQIDSMEKMLKAFHQKVEKLIKHLKKIEADNLTYKMDALSTSLNK